jgi:hypothetical protein
LKYRIAGNEVIITDCKTSYRTLNDIGKNHTAIVIKDKNISPVTHCKSTAKKKISGLHHSVKDIYMQNYLNEFCYEFNRRYFEIKLYDSLIVAALEKPWYKT